MRLSTLLLMGSCWLMAHGEEMKPSSKPQACWKDGVGRGVGELPEKETRKCPEGTEKSGGLCYAKCQGKHMQGIGPVCWDTCEGTKYPSNGLVFCCKTDEDCAQVISDLGRKLPEAVVKLAVDLAVNPAGIGKILKDFRAIAADVAGLVIPMCEKVFEGVEEEEIMIAAKGPTKKPTKKKVWIQVDEDDEMVTSQQQSKPTPKPTKKKRFEEDEEFVGGAKPTPKPTKKKAMMDAEDDQETIDLTRAQLDAVTIGGAKPTPKPTKKKSSYDDVVIDLVAIKEAAVAANEAGAPTTPTNPTKKPTKKPTKAPSKKPTPKPTKKKAAWEEGVVDLAAEAF